MKFSLDRVVETAYTLRGMNGPNTYEGAYFMNGEGTSVILPFLFLSCLDLLDPVPNALKVYKPGYVFYF